jgi:hypothetical protein
MGHLGSLPPNMVKPCLHSSGYIFDSFVIELGQDACLVNCSDEFEHGLSQIKNKELKIKKSC